MLDSLKAYFKLLWQNHPVRSCITLLHTFSSIILAVIIPYYMSMALADIVVGNMESFWGRVIVLSVAVVVASITNFVGFATAIRLAARLERLAINKAFEHLLSRSVGFHADNPGGKLVANATEYGRNSTRAVFDLIFTGLLPYILTSIIGIGVVFWNSTEIGTALIVVYVITMGFSLVESRHRSKIRVARKRAQDAVVANIADVITNAQTTKTFAREANEIETNDHLQHSLLGLRIKDWTSAAISGSVRLSVLLALQVVFVVYIALQIQNDPGYLGVGIYAFTYTIGMVSKLFELTTLLRTGEDALLSASTMTKYMLESPELQDRPDAKLLQISSGEIKFSDVKFSYPDSKDDTVFDQLNLHVPSGQRVGLVGKSGGGKSTVTRLLLRFEDVTGGQITFDGTDLRDVTQKSLRNSIGYVPQDPMLFHRTVSENIAYGKSDASHEEIVEAARRAHALDFIEHLPNKFDTVVGERGVKLSGGQRQRIAIARTILKNAPILVLDEATSALDSESEKLIQQSLETLMKGRTSIVIAHRLSTISKLDRILVLDDGQIIEDGTHSELLRASKTYARLWQHQSGGFIED